MSAGKAKKSKMTRGGMILATLGLVTASYTFRPTPTVAASSHAILNVRLPELKLDGAGLGDAIDFLRDVTGANIHVNWRALEAGGVNKDTVVNLRLRDVRLNHALDLLLNEAGGGGVALTYYYDQNVIEITTKDLADKQLFTVVYPVEDLLVEIPDFSEAPNFDLNAVSTGGSSGSSGGRGGRGSGGGGGGGGGGTGNIFGSNSGQNTEKTKTRQERADELVQLVRETVSPEIWHENGGPASIRYYSGKLIVTAPRSVHEALGGVQD